MAAGAAHPSHVPGVDYRALGRGEEASIQRRRAIGVQTLLPTLRDLEIAQHPLTLAAPAAERPASRDNVTAVDRVGAAAPRHSRTRDDRVGTVGKDFFDASIRQA